MFSKNRPNTAWPMALAFGAIGSLVVTLLVLAFLWPSRTAEVHDLPVSVAGPDDAVSALEESLEENAPGTFSLLAADDRADAVAQIEARETYGAIVLADGSGMPEVLTASAASTTAAQLLDGVAGELETQLIEQVATMGGDAAAVRVEVTDVVPLSDDDPAGTGLVAAAFPMMLGGIAGGGLISMLVVGILRRLAALAVFGSVTGIVLALVTQSWFGFLQGDFWLNALALGLSATATSSFIVGLAALFGTIGLSVGAMSTMLLGNPLSAAATPWQFLAEPWGAIGQLMVPGASNSLIRSLSYFPDADTTKQWLVLASWLVVGVVLALLGYARKRAAAGASGSTDEPSPAGVDERGGRPESGIDPGEEEPADETSTVPVPA